MEFSLINIKYRGEHSMIQKLAILAVGLGLVLGGHVLWAQTDGSTSGDLVALEEINVQGRQLEEKLSTELSDYGHHVQIVEGEKLVQTGYPTLYKALSRLVPGLYLPSNTVSSQLVGGTQMRLNGSTDFLVLLDGVRINNRMMGRTMSPDIIGVHIVDRVEVLAGGEGLFYGTDATGGVINIVTKKPTEEKSGSVRLSYGSYNDRDASAYVSAGVKGNKFLIYGHIQEYDGYRLLDKEIWDNAGFTVPAMNNPIGGQKADMKRSNYGIKFNREFDFGGPAPASLDVTFFKNDRKFQTPSPCTAANLTNNNCNVVNQYTHDETISFLKWAQDINENYSFFIKVYFHEWWAESTTKRASGEYVYDNAKFGYEDWGVHLLNSYRFDQGSEILFGVEYQNYWGKDQVTNMPSTKHEEVIGTYLSFRPFFAFWPAWKTSFGVRYNYMKENSSTNWNVSSKMPFFNDNMYLSASVGTSFKLPSSDNLFRNPQVSHGSGYTEGNQGLKPQTSRYINLGFGGNWEYGGFDLKVFWESVSDRIGSISRAGTWVPSAGIYADKYMNIPGKTKIRGYTLSGHTGPIYGFSATASYSRQEEIRNGVKQEFLSLFPKIFGDVGLRWDGKLGDWETGIGVVNNYVGKMKTRFTAAPIQIKEYGDYWTTDLEIHVKPLESLTISLQLSNLFDKDTIYNGWSRLYPQAGGPLNGKQSSDGYYYYGQRITPFTATLSVIYDF
ncbi:MAG: TonB-dependent receptor [Deltaproteobacteria bacterium]|nr:TonB-dependent receptor [Deltaproteobacteria bacterium]